jgi:hypothetical protein
MLQVAGIHATTARRRPPRHSSIPIDPSLFGNHMITAIEVPADVQDPRLMAIVKAKDGKRYLIFDPTNERTPVGNLPSYLSRAVTARSPPAHPARSSPCPSCPLTPTATTAKEPSPSPQTAPSTGSVEYLPLRQRGRRTAQHSSNTPMKRSAAKYWETSIARDVPGVVLNSFQFVQPVALDKPSKSTTSSPPANTPTPPARCCWSARASSAPMCCPSTTSPAPSPST